MRKTQTHHNATEAGMSASLSASCPPPRHRSLQSAGISSAAAPSTNGRLTPQRVLPSRIRHDQHWHSNNVTMFLCNAKIISAVCFCIFFVLIWGSVFLLIGHTIDFIRFFRFHFGCICHHKTWLQCIALLFRCSRGGIKYKLK